MKMRECDVAQPVCACSPGTIKPPAFDGRLLRFVRSTIATASRVASAPASAMWVNLCAAKRVVSLLAMARP
jgi:hypothetical protein